MRRTPRLLSGGTTDIQLMAADDSGKAISLMGVDDAQLLTATIEERANDKKKVTITFRAKSISHVWDKLQTFFSSSTTPLVKMRYGVKSGETEIWRNWEQFVLHAVVPDLIPDSQGRPTVSIVLFDCLYLLEAKQRSAARSNDPASAAANLWSEVSQTDTVLEQTRPLGSALYQLCDNGFDFLGYLRVSSLTKDGTGGYWFYVRGGNLHFHTPGYASNGTLTIPYIPGVPGFTDLVVVNANTVSDVLVAGWDPILSTLNVQASQSGLKVRLADLDHGYDATAINTAHVGNGNLEQTTAECQQWYSDAAFNRYRLTVRVSKCLDFEVGDLFEIELAAGLAVNQHSGLWVVSGVVHTIKDGDLVSAIVALRGEYRDDSTQVGGDSRRRIVQATQTAVLDGSVATKIIEP